MTEAVTKEEEEEKKEKINAMDRVGETARLLASSSDRTKGSGKRWRSGAGQGPRAPGRLGVKW